MEFDLRKDIEQNYLKYWKKIREVLKSRYWTSFSEEEIEDFASDMLLKAIEKKDFFEWQGENSPIKWILTLSIREALNRFQKRSYTDVDSMEDENIKHSVDISNIDFQEENLKSFYESVMDFIEKELSDLDRKLLLGNINGYTYEDLSLIFEVPLGTVKSKIHLGRKKILKQFKNIEI